MLDRSVEYQIRADVWKSLNGRPFQRWIDPSYNLRSATHFTWHYEWLLPRAPDANLDLDHLLRENVALENEKVYALDQNENLSSKITLLFFMGPPGETFISSLRPEICANVDVELHCLQGSIQLHEVQERVAALDRNKSSQKIFKNNLGNQSLTALRTAMNSISSSTSSTMIANLSSGESHLLPRNSVFVIRAGGTQAGGGKVSIRPSVWYFRTTCEREALCEGLGFFTT
mmetsp:Transcript_14067/g.19523  ORF Transcript_14067/g.19523 Transcript_14067/m.19523 type:complete len:230 (+) Transcript_14067:1746-2435(+)